MKNITNQRHWGRWEWDCQGNVKIVRNVKPGRLIRLFVEQFGFLLLYKKREFRSIFRLPSFPIWTNLTFDLDDFVLGLFGQLVILCVSFSRLRGGRGWTGGLEWSGLYISEEKKREKLTCVFCSCKFLNCWLSDVRPLILSVFSSLLVWFWCCFSCCRGRR